VTGKSTGLVEGAAKPSQLNRHFHHGIPTDRFLITPIPPPPMLFRKNEIFLLQMPAAVFFEKQKLSLAYWSAGLIRGIA